MKFKEYGFDKTSIATVVLGILTTFLSSYLVKISTNRILKFVFLMATLVMIAYLLRFLIKKYMFYRSIAKHLCENARPLYSTISYLVGKARVVQKGLINPFRISSIHITYVLSNFDTTFTTGDIFINYNAKCFNNTNRKITKIFHRIKSLDNEKNISSKIYRINDMDFSELEKDSRHGIYFANVDDENIINPDTDFSYDICIMFEKGFNLMTSNYYIVDPENYSHIIQEIKLTIEIKNCNEANFINDNFIVRLSEYKNSNISQNNLTDIKFTSKKIGLYTNRIVPHTDSIYLVEFKKKKNTN